MISLCILSYNRPYFLQKAVESAVDGADDSFQLIVHDDGSTDPVVDTTIKGLIESGYISHVIKNPPGHNEGVGEAVRKSFAIASGDLLVKADQDLVFENGWDTNLKNAFNYDNSLIEDVRRPLMVGGFRYYHDPVDFPKTLLAEDEHYDEVTHFCGSLFALPALEWEDWIKDRWDTHLDAFNEDWNLMKYINECSYICNVITKTDIVKNQGFGIGPSTVVVSEGVVQTINHGSKLV